MKSSTAVHLYSVVLCVIAIGNTARSAYCPTFCDCDTWYGLQRVSCIGRHLYSIHTDAPSTVQALDLSNNSISALNSYELANAGLKTVKYLGLAGNSISEVDLYAFAGLENLAVLDLSRNRLRYLLSATFADNKNLRVLKLSRNNFNTHVPKLQCSTLTELSMDSCLISHIPVDTFNRLGQLRNLDLSNNMMIQLDSLVVQTLPLLRKLSLDGNTWSCNKATRDLELYLKHRKVQFNPVCEKTPVKKFERMILPAKKPESRPALTKQSANAKSTESSPTRVEENSPCVRMTNTRVTLTTTPTSPYWFILSGFLLGSAITLIASYIWFTSKLSCRRGRTYSREAPNDIQCVSLLNSLWQADDRIVDDRSRMNCPDTPPPPYRDVILRPGLYRTP